ncbi:MAG: GntP family permease, partial [Treponema sp.]|nr:GntP family permease [Treponema sp.]
MTGLALIIVFIIAIIVMILAISKLRIHPFLSIMAVSLIFGLVAGIPLVNVTVDGKTTQGIANV